MKDRSTQRLEPRPLDASLAALIQDVDAIIWEMDAGSDRFNFVSRRAEHLLGHPVRCWLEEPDFWADRVVHPEDRDYAMELCARATAEGRDHAFEYRAVAADGSIVWLRDVVRVVTGADGRVLLRGVMLDITEQKRAEAALAESEERYRRLIENSSDIIHVFDETGTPADAEAWRRRTDKFLAELCWYARALKAARADGVPYT